MNGHKYIASCALALLSGSSLLAQDERYISFIYEYPLKKNGKEDGVYQWMDIEIAGSRMSDMSVGEGGSNFVLFTAERDTPSNNWLLDEKHVPADPRTVELTNSTLDPYNPNPIDPSKPQNGGRYIRMRADKTYDFTIKWGNGFMPPTSNNGSYACSNIVVVHEYKSAETGSDDYELNDSWLISKSGNNKFDNNKTIIPAADAIRANGSEFITLLGVPSLFDDDLGDDDKIKDYTLSEAQKNEVVRFYQEGGTGDNPVPIIFNSFELRVCPVPDAEISGITDGQVIGAELATVVVTVDYNNLYPGSDTYLVIYKKGTSRPGKTDSYLFKTIPTDTDPVSVTANLYELDKIVTEDGYWIMEVIHESIYGTEVLGEKQINVPPRINVKADINTIR